MPKGACGTTDSGPHSQGILTVLNRHTSFGTFGGGDANTCDALCSICDKSGGITTPGGNGGIGSPPGATITPGGTATPGGGGKSVAWSTTRTDPHATEVSPVRSGAAVQSARIARAAAPAKIACHCSPVGFVMPKRCAVR
jgi:hypothetical protein